MRIFYRNFSRDYEERLSSHLPYSAILPYRSFAFAMTEHSSKLGRLRDPYKKTVCKPADYF